MTRLSCILLLLGLAACTSPPARQWAESPCQAGEATYACQVKRYHDVSSP